MLAAQAQPRRAKQRTLRHPVGGGAGGASCMKDTAAMASRWHIALSGRINYSLIDGAAAEVAARRH